MNSQSLVGTAAVYVWVHRWITARTGESVPTLWFIVQWLTNRAMGLRRMSDNNFFVYPSARLGFTNIYTYFPYLSQRRRRRVENLEQGLQICLRSSILIPIGLSWMRLCSFPLWTDASEWMFLACFWRGVVVFLLATLAFDSSRRLGKGSGWLSEMYGERDCCAS